MNMKRFFTFAGKVSVAHLVTYFIAGAVAYPFLTKQFYVGPDPLFAVFMRTEAEPDLWRHAMAWFIPGQILRGVIMAAALYPFFDALNNWTFRKRFLSLAGIYLVFAFWSSAVAAPGTIDGMIYMRPEFTAYAHLAVQPEIIAQGLGLAAWVAWWMPPKTDIPATNA